MSGEGARVGILSDTHGLLRPELFDVFEGVDRILHAGDVGDPDILADLGAIAPVEAVWGNVDEWEVRDRTREALELRIGGVGVAVAHGHRVEPEYARLLDRFPAADLVIHGHTHEPSLDRLDGRWLLNPGAAGHRRFRLPVSVALARLEPGSVEIEFVELETGRRGPRPADVTSSRSRS